MKGHVKTGYVGNGGWCIPLPFIDYRRLFLLPQRWSPTRVHQGRNVSASLITSRADIGDNRTDRRPTEPPCLCNHYLSVGLRFLLPFISGNLIAARENSKRKHHLCIPQVINTHFYEKSFRFSRCGMYILLGNLNRVGDYGHDPNTLKTFLDQNQHLQHSAPI